MSQRVQVLNELAEKRAYRRMTRYNHTDEYCVVVNWQCIDGNGRIEVLLYALRRGDVVNWERVVINHITEETQVTPYSWFIEAVGKCLESTEQSIVQSVVTDKVFAKYIEEAKSLYDKGM